MLHHASACEVWAWILGLARTEGCSLLTFAHSGIMVVAQICDGLLAIPALASCGVTAALSQHGCLMLAQ